MNMNEVNIKISINKKKVNVSSLMIKYESTTIVYRNSNIVIGLILLTPLYLPIALFYRLWSLRQSV